LSKYVLAVRKNNNENCAGLVISQLGLLSPRYGKKTCSKPPTSNYANCAGLVTGGDVPLNRLRITVEFIDM
jgi:hypothetical protein